MNHRIIINGKWKRQSRVTGVQRYASELIDAFDRAGFEYEFVLPGSGGRIASNLWEQFTLPRLVEDYDVLFCPANMAPLRLPRPAKLVLTIHCLRFHFHPENYARSFVRWYRYAVPRLIRRATMILTVSQSTADEIERVYPQAKNKVRAVYPGVSNAFQPEGPTGDSALGDEPYWMYIGSIAPAKNLATLVEALSHSSHRHRIALAGVSSGDLARLPRPELHDRLVPLGHINDTPRLASIIQGSLGLLAPSRYESFDFPVVEAMACGSPVIASDIPVHREIADEAAMLIEPDRADLWARAMDELADAASKRHNLTRRGLARSARFNWDDAAREIMKILQEGRR